MIVRRELSKEDIAHRAYELYTQRGSEPGKDVEDWVSAEEQLSVEPGFASARARAAQQGQN
jgi:Protein of unknown function (DUF2934)